MKRVDNYPFSTYTSVMINIMKSIYLAISVIVCFPPSGGLPAIGLIKTSHSSQIFFTQFNHTFPKNLGNQLMEDK